VRNVCIAPDKKKNRKNKGGKVNARVCAQCGLEEEEELVYIYSAAAVRNVCITPGGKREKKKRKKRRKKEQHTGEEKVLWSELLRMRARPAKILESLCLSTLPMIRH